MEAVDSEEAHSALRDGFGSGSFSKTHAVLSVINGEEMVARNTGSCEKEKLH